MVIRLLDLNATPPDDGDNQVVLGVGEAVADEESGDDVAQDEGSIILRMQAASLRLKVMAVSEICDVCCML